MPLILKLPGGRARAARGWRRRRSSSTSSRPSSSLVGVAAPQGGRGRVPRPAAARPGPPAAPRDLYAETFYPRLHFGWSELASLIRDRFHYIQAPAPELYDLAADPGEKQQRPRPRAPRLRRAARRSLQGMERQLQAPAAVDPETARKLAALGYASGAASTGSGGGAARPQEPHRHARATSTAP